MIEGATVVALHKTVPSHFEFLPSKSNLMIRFGDVTYQIKKGLLGDRNRSGQ